MDRSVLKNVVLDARARMKKGPEKNERGLKFERGGPLFFGGSQQGKHTKKKRKREREMGEVGDFVP